MWLPPLAVCVAWASRCPPSTSSFNVEQRYWSSEKRIPSSSCSVWIYILKPSAGQFKQKAWKVRLGRVPPIPFFFSLLCHIFPPWRCRYLNQGCTLLLPAYEMREFVLLWFSFSYSKARLCKTILTIHLLEIGMLIWRGDFSSGRK